VKDLVFVTGNDHKAKYFSKMVGFEVERVSLDLDEIQSLDLQEVIEHKVKQAYKVLKRPVIVEDTKLVFNALGALPGPFIKYFLDELGADGLCKLLNSYSDRSAVAGAAIAYYDGATLKIFENKYSGEIALKPKGESGFGWNRVFIPSGEKITLGEMTEEEFKKHYQKIKPFKEIAEYLKIIDKSKA
jgi:non-canonical purine NTP pyrophosphatase (RdgB/HAM1 family)